MTRVTLSNRKPTKKEWLVRPWTTPQVAHLFVNDEEISMCARVSSLRASAPMQSCDRKCRFCVRLEPK